MEVEVADEVEGLLPPPPSLLRRAVCLEEDSTLYMGSLAMKFWEHVHLVLVIPKTYHSLKLEFLCESYA
jgi:hypothetical protein